MFGNWICFPDESRNGSDITVVQISDDEGKTWRETEIPDSADVYKRQVVKRAGDAGVPYIYKKTDSGLRGNIGKELEAALLASGEQYLTFIPALPAMDRITVGGVHYVEGVPIHESVFGRDPFEPVVSPSVEALFCGVSVKTVSYQESEHYERGRGKEIGIFDASSEAQIKKITEDLMKQKCLGVMAGCAGFASVLGDFLKLEIREVEIPAITDRTVSYTHLWPDRLILIAV